MHFISKIYTKSHKIQSLLLLLLTIFNNLVNHQVVSWYTGLHGPGLIPEMLLKCFNDGYVPCTPLKTVAAWYDESRKGNTRSFGGDSGGIVPVITYSSADGNDITTYLFQLGEGIVDVEEFDLRNSTIFRLTQVHVFCCVENHVEGGTGDN